MGYLAKGFLMLSLSLMGMAAAATELQGFKDIKFGMFPSDLCGVKYLKRSICKARHDDTPIEAFVALGNQNLGGLTAFGFVVEHALIIGTWRDGVRTIILDSGGTEDALVATLTKSFGDPEYWEEPKSDGDAKLFKGSADLTRVYYWAAENGASIFLELDEWLIDKSDTARLAEALTPEYYDGRKRRELPTLKFESVASTKDTLRAAATYRARSIQEPDANDF